MAESVLDLSRAPNLNVKDLQVGMSLTATNMGYDSVLRVTTSKIKKITKTTLTLENGAVYTVRTGQFFEGDIAVRGGSWSGQNPNLWPSDHPRLARYIEYRRKVEAKQGVYNEAEEAARALTRDRYLDRDKARAAISALRKWLDSTSEGDD